MLYYTFVSQLFSNINTQNILQHFLVSNYIRYIIWYIYLYRTFYSIRNTIRHVTLHKGFGNKFLFAHLYTHHLSNTCTTQTIFVVLVVLL